MDEHPQELQDVNRSNVLQVRIDSRDALYVDDQPATLAGLQQQVESFVASRQSDRHIIAVEADRQASYNAYFEMQNAVMAAYRSLRDRAARRRYGHGFSQCSPEERDDIVRRYPLKISEGIPAAKGGERP